VAFFLVVLVLGILVLRRGGYMRASFRGATWEISSEAKRGAERDLAEASRAKPTDPDALAQAREQLTAVTQIRVARVMWVDDNPAGNVHEVLMLSRLGLAISQVTSSAAALEVLGSSPYELLITDLTRDGNRVAGLNLLRHLRNVPIPKIIYALDVEGRANEARQLGATAVETTPAGLLQAVLNALARH